MVGNNTGPNRMGSADSATRTNGVAGDKPAAHPFNPDFTRLVIEAMGPDTSPRNRIIFGSLIRHLHDFARDVELSYDEWMAGVDFINSLGKINTPKRNEAQRVSDILGLETLVDEISHKTVTEGKLEPTSSTILGPFWSAHAPFRNLGGSIIQDLPPKARVTKMHGLVRDMVTGEPIPNAVLDVWQASANGQYDFQDPDNQTPNNLRGKFRADHKGEYWFYCLYPTAYVLPTDGPSGKLLDILNRHPMRPAHIHVIVSHPEYLGCTTQLYPRDCPWVKSDTVFAVKPDLVVDFKPLEGDDKATLDLEYNVSLVPKDYKGKARE